MKSRETLIRLRKFQVDEKRRRVAQIESMVADFDRMAADLDREIATEQDRAGIHDPTHFAYPTYAKAAIGRRDNLKRSADELKGQLEEARLALAEAFEELKKVELLDERDQMRERVAENARDQAEMDRIGTMRGAARSASGIAPLFAISSVISGRQRPRALADAYCSRVRLHSREASRPSSLEGQGAMPAMLTRELVADGRGRQGRPAAPSSTQWQTGAKLRVRRPAYLAAKRPRREGDQETYLEDLAQCRHRRSEGRRTITWMVAIARNRALDVIRKSGFRSRTGRRDGSGRAESPTRWRGAEMTEAARRSGCLGQLE